MDSPSKEYTEMMVNRLADILDEMLHDDDISIDVIYDTIIETIKSNRAYYINGMDRSNQLLTKFTPIQLQQQIAVSPEQTRVSSSSSATSSNTFSIS